MTSAPGGDSHDDMQYSPRGGTPSGPLAPDQQLILDDVYMGGDKT